jgi:hypothetical protein
MAVQLTDLLIVERAGVQYKTPASGLVDLSGALPLGGTTGQVATKASNSDNDVVWATPSGGSGSYNPALGWAY